MIPRNSQDGRKIALDALMEVEQKGGFLHEALEEMRSRGCPENELRLAQEISYGVMRRRLFLDDLIEKFSKKKPGFKAREKMLLRMVLYQILFMDRIPHYAALSEAKKLCNVHVKVPFISFATALSKQIEGKSFKLGENPSLEEIGAYFSFPLFLVAAFAKQWGEKRAREVMELFNRPAPLIVRKRPNASEKTTQLLISKGKAICENFFQLDALAYQEIKDSDEIYVQNPAQYYLLERLNQTMLESPKRILDLCAAPGGKLLVLSEMYPKAQLIANDMSQKRLAKLKQNIAKYGIKAEVTCERGEEYLAKQPFDLIVIDTPCSNTGVLHKRPEARYRCTQEHIKEIAKLQRSLLENASRLLSENGLVWYLTCSLLEQENEMMVREACESLGYFLEGEMHTVFPNNEGWDGGFGVLLRRKI